MAERSLINLITPHAKLLYCGLIQKFSIEFRKNFSDCGKLKFIRTINLNACSRFPNKIKIESK